MSIFLFVTSILDLGTKDPSSLSVKSLKSKLPPQCSLVVLSENKVLIAHVQLVLVMLQVLKQERSCATTESKRNYRKTPCCTYFFVVKNHNNL